MPDSEDLITPEEIKTIIAGAKTITTEMVMRDITRGKIEPVKPVKLKSGYSVSMTYDELLGKFAEHISVYKQDADPADVEIIAHAIIGDYTYRRIGVLNEHSIHFIKIVKISDDT